VLISDATTDEALLERTLHAAATHARHDGSARPVGRLALLRVERNSRRELDGVMSRLIGYREAQQASV
jgi:hypothetical protein